MISTKTRETYDQPKTGLLCAVMKSPVLGSQLYKDLCMGVKREENRWLSYADVSSTSGVATGKHWTSYRRLASSITHQASSITPASQ